MNACCSTVVFGAIALIAQGGVARANGQLTGIKLTNSDIVSCAIETVTIEGTGDCPGLSVSFGDGQNVLFLTGPHGQPPKLPLSLGHRYHKLGSYNVSAEGSKGSCPGTPKVTVQVAAGPQITGLVPFLSQVTPGGNVLIEGQFFVESAVGQVLLHLDYKDGKFGNDVPLKVLRWNDKFIYAQVPADGAAVSGAADQDTTIKVVNACGVASSPLATHYRAAVDILDLAYAPAPDHPAPWISCAMSSGVSGSDACQDNGQTNYPQECNSGRFAPWGMQGGVSTLGGYHASGWGTQGEDGSDVFVALSPLLNGWTVNSTSVDWSVQAGNGGVVALNQGQSAQTGATTPTLGVDYHIFNCGAMFYVGHIFIIGPKGVPF